MGAVILPAGPASGTTYSLVCNARISWRAKKAAEAVVLDGLAASGCGCTGIPPQPNDALVDFVVKMCCRLRQAEPPEAAGEGCSTLAAR